MTNIWLFLYYPLLEAKRKLFSMKYLTVIIITGFMCVLYTISLRKFSYLIGYSITPWFYPFLISINFYNLIYFALFIYFFSDAPFFQRNTIYQMIRCGRIKWGLIQIRKILMSSFIYIISGILVSVMVMFPYVRLDSGWGNVIYTLSRTDAWKNYEVSLSFNYDIIVQKSPLQMMILTTIILWLAGTCIGLLMFALSLWIGRMFALFVSTIWVILPIILDNYAGVWRPLAIHFSPISWTRITEIGQFKYGIPRLPSLIFILSAYIMMCVIFSIAALIKLRTIDLKWSSEES